MQRLFGFNNEELGAETPLGSKFDISDRRETQKVLRRFERRMTGPVPLASEGFAP